MATFVSQQSGNWNDYTTWLGKTAGQYPGAGDVVTISQGDLVTYNVSSTAVLGAITCAGTMSFLKSMNTKMVMGLGGITINDGGGLLLGTAVNPIEAAYKAELYLDTTSMGLHWDLTYRSPHEGIKVVPGGTLDMYGSSAYYGSTPTVNLAADWTSGLTFTVVGDVTGKWLPGMEIVVPHAWAADNLFTHGFPSCLPVPSSAPWADCHRFVIDTVVLNGANTEITVTGSFPDPAPTAYTWVGKAGLPVAVLSRNVIYGRLNAEKAISAGAGLNVWGDYLNGHMTYQHQNAGIYSYNTGADVGHLNFSNVDFLAASLHRGHNKVIDSCVFRNGSEIDGYVTTSVLDPNGMVEPTGCSITNNIFYLVEDIRYHDGFTFTGNKFYSCYRGLAYCDDITSTGNYWVGGENCFYGCENITVPDNLSGVHVALEGCLNSAVSGTISDVVTASSYCEGTTFTGNISGYVPISGGENNTYTFDLLTADDLGRYPVANTTSGQYGKAIWGSTDCTFNCDIWTSGVVIISTTRVTINADVITARSICLQGELENVINLFTTINDATINGINDLADPVFNYGVASMVILFNGYTHITLDGCTINDPYLGRIQGEVAAPWQSTILRYDNGLDGPIGGEPSWIKFLNIDGVAGHHMSYFYDGTVESDPSVTTADGSYSIKAIPRQNNYPTVW